MAQTRIIPGDRPGDRYRVELEIRPNCPPRTLSIEGPIHHNASNRPGLGALADLSAFDHRGHLIAHRFGGPSAMDSGNLVPMHGRINMSGTPWFQMESQIARFLGQHGDGQMKVECKYKGDDSRPHSFCVEVTFPNGMRSTWRHFNFNPALRPAPAR